MRKFINNFGSDILTALLFVSIVLVANLLIWEFVVLYLFLLILVKISGKYFSVFAVFLILCNCFAYYNGGSFSHKFMLYHDKSVVVCNVREKDVSQCLQSGQGELQKYDYLGRFWTK